MSPYPYEPSIDGAAERLRVGVFVPPAPDPERSPGPLGPVATRPGMVPPPDHRVLMDLLAGLADVDLVPDVDVRRSHIRDGRVYCGDRCVSDLDVYVWYAEVERALGGYQLEVLRTLAQDVTVVPAPAAFERGLDKYWAHHTLRRAGVRVPETLLFDHRHLDPVEAVLDEWGSALLKPRWGSFGRGVLLVENFPTVRDVLGFHAAAAPGGAGHAFLLERFYPNDADDWVSAVVIDGELMYGYRKRGERRAALGGGGRGAWKVFDADGHGGHVDRCEVSAAHRDQALRAQRALGMPIVGFDMILHRGEPVVVDENTFPGLYPELFAEAGQDLGRQFFRVVLGAIETHRRRAAGGRLSRAPGP
ncbi:ATP-grasp domain-containing protein [Streptomyces sp. URMC 123]|uniref:ATP-grasp domain-containing protein n=1 Tax=Streptomyces sp. URMC 123 TaxID=3423403 RepID=UPI003F1A80EC